MKVFIDTESLSSVNLPPAVADKLTALVANEYSRDEVLYVRPDDRVRVLAQLVEGAGVAVVCGSSKVGFWSAVSHEVQLWVQPDNYLVRRRTSGMQWALEAQGLSVTAATALIKNPPKTEKHGMWETYQHAQGWLEILRVAALAIGPIVDGRLPVEILKGEEAIQFIRGLDTGARSDDNPVSIDLEYHKDTHEPHGVNIAYDAVIGSTFTRVLAYIPFMAKDYTAEPGFAVRVFREIENLHDRCVHSVYHNGKSDLAVIAEHTGRDPLRVWSNIHDTIVMSYVAGYSELGLKEMTPELLGREAMQYPGDLSQLPVALAAQYGAAGDANNTLDLYHALRKKLTEQQQWHVYKEIEAPLVPLVASMEWGGSPMDVKQLYREKRSIEVMLQALAAHVWVKERLNLFSDHDQLEFATRKLGYNPGTLSNEKLAPKSEEAWLDTLIGFRKLRHRLRAFIDKQIERWRRQGYPNDYRAYSSFNQAGSTDERDERSFKRAPRTGRFSSSAQRRGGEVLGDNLQNQPQETRAAYVAPEGCVMFSYDHSSLEMRIAAAVSGDPEMLRVLTEVCPSPGEDGECPHLPKHGDPHGQFQYKAIDITGVDVGRTVAKNWNFGMNYNAGVDTQMKTLAKARSFITREVAEKLHSAHHEIYHVYHASSEARQAEAERRGYSVTEFGRRRYDPDLASSDNTIRGHARRAAGNMGIQGTAADLIKKEMGELIPVLLFYNAHLSSQVHDELVGWVPKVNAEAFDREVRKIMSSHKIRGLEMTVSGGLGRTWAEAH